MYRYNSFRSIQTKFARYHRHQVCCFNHGSSAEILSSGFLTRSSATDARKYHTYHKSKSYYILRPPGGLPNPAVVNSPSYLLHTYNLNSNLLVHVQFFHTSGKLNKEESRVEKTVKTLKKQLSKQKEQKEPVTKIEDVSPAPLKKKSLWSRFVAEVKHYWHGFRLFLIEIRVSRRLIWKVLNGKTLARREKKQLLRTTSDIFRMVPFSIFIIIPFMELLLPFAIAMFPNLLPSTFEAADKKHEKFKKKLKVKLEVAKFLQETVEQTPLVKTQASQDTQEKFVDFLTKVRSSGEQPTTEDILRFCKFFEDELTLDHLSLNQLHLLCKLLEINTLGVVFSNKQMLRFQLYIKLRILKADDKMIQREGIDSLNEAELQAANRARGMRALGVSINRQKSQLQQWLDLHLNEEVPTSLLLLSRTLYQTDTITEETLKQTISALPDTTTEGAKIKLSEDLGEKLDNKARLEFVRQEEAALKQEMEEQATADEELRKMQESVKLSTETIEENIDEILEDRAPSVDAKIEEELKDRIEAEEEEISGADLEQLEAVVEDIVEEKMECVMEAVELDELKEDVSEYNEDVEDLGEVVLASGGQEKDLMESKVAKRSKKVVVKMIDRLTKEINRPQSEKESDTIIETSVLVESMKRFEKVDNEPRTQQIVKLAQSLDEDADGKINLDLVHDGIELIGSGKVKITKALMSEVLNLLKKEALLEEEEKQKEKEEKRKQREQGHEQDPPEQPPEQKKAAM